MRPEKAEKGRTGVIKEKDASNRKDKFLTVKPPRILKTVLYGGGKC